MNTSIAFAPLPARSILNKSYCFLAAILSLLVHSCTASTNLKNTMMEGNWLIELEHADIGLVRTTMSFYTDDNTFEAGTRRGADKDILGGWTSFLGRTFTSNFKKGCLLRIEKGILLKKNDTLKFAGIFSSALGNTNINGFIINEQLFARIGNSKHGYKGSIKGSRKTISSPMEDYPAIFEKAVFITKDHIYNKQLLKTKEWNNFMVDMRKVSHRVKDDLEMVFAFFYYGRKLPVSHYALMKMRNESTRQQEEESNNNLFLEEKNARLAYLKIKSFDGTASEVDSIFSIIRQKGYSDLIIDLRNNSGGSVAAGMALATNVADSTFYGGIFLTQKYFNRYVVLPKMTDYPSFPHFSAANFDLIIEGIHNTEGLCLKVVPQDVTYKGRLYILTNKQTASTCEPIVYGLKQRKLATIIGERTAGAMLNGEVFEVANGFKIVIPTADYYTSDGYRIDQNGVQPDIEVKSDEALEYALRKALN